MSLFPACAARLRPVAAADYFLSGAIWPGSRSTSSVSFGRPQVRASHNDPRRAMPRSDGAI
jgi:hypothetical protein